MKFLSLIFSALPLLAAALPNTSPLEARTLLPRPPTTSAPFYSPTIQYLTVDSNITFAYIDSGAVKDFSAYRTILTVHGDGFNGGVYSQLFPIASDLGVRIVSVYRRDYAPTTLLTPAELAPILSFTTTGSAEFLQARGEELLTFLDTFIQQNTLGTGGLTVLGWSLGAAYVSSMLANLDSVSSATLTRFEQHWDSVLFHDPANDALGLGNAPSYDISLFYDAEPEQFDAFSSFFESYFNHTNQNYPSGTEATLDLNVPETNPAPSFTNVPSSLYQTLVSEYAYSGSDTGLLFTADSVTADVFAKACFNTTMAKILPNLKVHFYHGGETAGNLVYGIWQVQDIIATPSLLTSTAVTARSLQVAPYSGYGNHFMHWDYPTYTLAYWLLIIDLDY